MAIELSQGLSIGSGNPVDDRYVFDSFDAISIPKVRRYKGLKIYCRDTGLEYWFRDGVEMSDLIPYHSGAGLLCVGTTEERDAIPASVRFEGMEVNVVSDGTLIKYTLIGGITNGDWFESTPYVNNWTVIS